MGIFSRRGEPAVPAAAEQDQPLADPRLADDDPRQLLFGLLASAGIVFALRGPGDVDELLREALRASPVLARSRHHGNGFFALVDDPATLWVAVGGPGGSAVLVVGSPDSDSDMLFTTITKPFDSVPAPFASGFVFSGATKPALKAVIDAARIVPAWEVAEFRFLAPDGRDAPPPPTAAVPATAAPTPAPGSAAPPTAAAPPLARAPRPDRIRLAGQPVPAPATSPAAPAAASAPPDPSSLWHRIERPDAGGRLARRVDWPAAPGEFTTVERVRESVAGEGSLFSTLDRLARRLRSRRGSGFEHSWRGSDDQPLSPSWLALRSAAIDVESGRIVACGHSTHEVWNLPSAYDLGAVDGRNMSSFADDGHGEGLVAPPQSLYIGSIGSGTMMPLDARVNLVSVDLYGPDGSIACLEFLGASTGAVTVYDRGGARRVLAVIDGIAGNEPIRFSGDGGWLLVSRSRDSVLVEVSTGRWTVLELADAGWWPLDGSSLLVVEHADGVGTPRVFSLAANEFTRSFPAIALDVPTVPDFPSFWNPAVSPNGRELLVRTAAGVTPEYQRKNGSGSRLARVALATGRGSLTAGAYLDDYQTLERDVAEARWSGRAPGAPLVLHPDLAARLEEPVGTHPQLDSGMWAGGAEQILVRSLNRMITLAQEGGEIAHLLPEVLASLAAVAHDAEIMARQREWLLGLRAATDAMVADGSVAGASATAWRRFGAAVDAVETGRPERVDPLDATWA